MTILEKDVELVFREE